MKNWVSSLNSRFITNFILGPRKVVSIVTDNAPNMKKAWRLIGQKYPWIVSEGCKAHSVDLVAKDLCETASIGSVVEKCVKIAKFFR